MSRRVLVTGASGMLGRATAIALRDQGDDVTVMQRRPAGIHGVRESLGDLTDAAAVAAAVAGQDAVVHLAAKVDVVGPWAEYHRVNVVGTETLVGAARRAGVRRFVQVSSPSVAHAGHALVGVGAEVADPRSARGNYARSKAAAERLALRASTDGFAVLAIRPHLVWGPGDTQLVQRIVDRARSGRLPILGTGAALIDTTYVDNAASALVAAVDACDRAPGEALVVTNGEPRPVAEILERLCRSGSVPPPSRHVPARVGWAAGAVAEGLWTALRRSDVPPLTRFLAEQLSTAHWFDQRRTREVLRWEPAITLDEGFDRLTTAQR